MALLAALTPAPGTKIGDMRWHCGAMATSGETIVRAGWLACNGAAVSRTTYAALFAVVGTAYGVGNGSTTFNLPDCTDGKNPLSKGATNFTTRGATGGEYTHSLTTAEEPPHTHNYSDNPAPTSGSGSYGQLAGTFSGEDHGGNRVDATGVPQGQGGGAAAAHQNMPPVQTVGGKMIRYL